MIYLKTPKHWDLIERRVDGEMFSAPGDIAVIYSIATELDGKNWIHISVSRIRNVPNYYDMVYVKEQLLGEDSKAIMVFPPRKEWINIHPNCLHIFSCLDGDGLPDFTQGSNSL